MFMLAICFALGVSFTHTLSHLYPLLAIIILTSALGLAAFVARQWLRKLFIYGTVFSLGLAWATWYAGSVLSWKLPAQWEDKPLLVEGYISAVPMTYARYTQFTFVMLEIKEPAVRLVQPVRVRINWYGDHPELSSGQYWQLAVRLKRPHSRYNPGGLDVSARLFQQRIRAVGYVLSSGNQPLSRELRWQGVVDRIRHDLAKRLSNALPNSQYIGFIQALTLGMKTKITPEQWELLRFTGTTHLMAISGLHIGLLAGLGYGITRWLWRFTGKLCEYIPTPQAAALGSLVVAIGYSVLAGFELPTQRALIMVGTAVIALLLNRQVLSWGTWSAALLGVLLVDPVSPLSAGFWLSFGAVALLIYGIQGRLNPRGGWWRWGRAQWIVSIGLLPLSLYWFQQASLLSLPANILAIPWVGFLIVPTSLLACLMLRILPELGDGLLHWVDKSLIGFDWFLTQLASLRLGYWQQAIANDWLLLPTLVGILLLLAPSAFPCRWLGIAWLLPLLRWQPVGPSPGEFWFTLLDVGQGLASVVRTAQHTLVYDTGGYAASQVDAGNMILALYLRQQALYHIDKLIISHAHDDHYGGASSLVRQFSVQEVIASFPAAYPSVANHVFCQAEQMWDWDGVHFKMLYPLPQQRLDQLKINNRSCVLKIENEHHQLLLTGDIEQAAEQRLLMQYGQALRSEVMQVPHHGSVTSSTLGFLQTVQPRYAVIPVGYHNRYGLPHPKVVARYLKKAVSLYDSPNCGAITFKFSSNSQTPAIECYRKKRKRYWQ